MTASRVVHEILDQANESADVARQAFAAGDLVVAIAALVLAAQLVQLAHILTRPA